MARAAGRSLRILALVAGLLPAASPAAAAEDWPDGLLSPERTIQSLLSPPAPGAPPRLVQLFQATSMAASGDQLVIYDRGQQQLVRVDIASNQARVIATAGPLAPWRVRPMPSQDVLLIARDASQVRQLTPSGSVRQSFASVELTQPVDAAFDPRHNSVLVIDFDGRVHEFSMLGVLHRTSTLLSERGTTPSALVRGPDSYFLADTACACIIELDDAGLPLRLIGQGEFPQLGDLAVDGFGRLWTTDFAGQTLRMTHADETSSSVAANRLGIASIASIAIDQNRLFVAERGTGRILVFVISPPGSHQ